MSIYDVFFFDLDGTLTDSREGIFASLRYALQFFGKEADDALLLPCIGPPLMESFQERMGFTEADAHVAVAKYREYYREKGIFENRLYPGVEAMLGALKEKGHTLCLATSKPEVFARQILEYFQIFSLFDVVSGADLQGGRNSKIDVLRHACQEAGGVSIAACLMTGDRKYDILAANTLGMASVGALWGYGSRCELEEAGASCILEDIEAFRKHLCI